MEEESRIQVAVRIRPRLEYVSSERYSVDCCRKMDPNTLYVTNPLVEGWEFAHKNTYTFDHIFDHEDAQIDVYNTAANALVDTVLSGHPSTVVAYGQTGSGKTHTMCGTIGTTAEADTINDDMGIFFRAVTDILAYRDKNASRLHLAITISAMEIYNEDIRDLLGPAKKSLPLKLKNGDEYVDLTTVQVSNAKEVQSVFAQAGSHRATSSHLLNDTSSRSHALFLLEIYQQEKSDGNPEPPDIFGAQASNDSKFPIIQSRLTLVDLAGSERVKRTQVEGAQLKETQAINLSLTCLGNVISGLYSEKSHIPYRDSKLTRILKPSFSCPDSRVLVITCLAPTADSFNETVSSLKFADRVKGLENKGVFAVGDDIAYEQDYLLHLKARDELCADLRIAMASGYRMTRSMGHKFSSINEAVAFHKERKINHSEDGTEFFREKYLCILRNVMESSEVLSQLKEFQDKQDLKMIEILEANIESDVLAADLLNMEYEQIILKEARKKITKIRHEAKSTYKHLKKDRRAVIETWEDFKAEFYGLDEEWSSLELQDVSLSKGSEACDAATDQNRMSVSDYAHNNAIAHDNAPEALLNTQQSYEAPQNGNGCAPLLANGGTATVNASLDSDGVIYSDGSSPEGSPKKTCEVVLRGGHRQSYMSPQEQNAVMQHLSAMERNLSTALGGPQVTWIISNGRKAMWSPTILIAILRAIALLAEALAANRRLLNQWEAGELILGAMQAHSTDPSIQGQSIAALLHLSRDNENMTKSCQLASITYIVKAMKQFQTNASLLTVANAALWSLATQTENKVAIAKAGGIIQIINSMRTFSRSPDLLTRANAALCNLAYDADNAITIAQKGGVDQILAAMSTFPNLPDLLTSAGVALSNLAVHYNINHYILNRGGINFILSSMRNFPNHEALNCRALAALCSMALTDESRLEIGEEGGVEAICQAMWAFEASPYVLTKANATFWNLSEHPTLKAMIKQKGGFDLIRRSMKLFPKCEDLVREANGALKGERFVQS